MNDRDVKEQLKRMVAFIESEARDKAQEIRVRAEEEFQVQKQSVEQAEKLKITKQYERAEKDVEIQRRIAISNAINDNRLKILKAREDMILKLYADAKRQLAELSNNRAAYKNLLQALILQGLLKLQEPVVVVRVREVDKDLAKDCLAGALQAYKEKTGLNAQLTIDSKTLAPPPSASNLGASCSGGAVLLAFDGRITCDNTLDQRLALAFEQRLPDVRKLLFGASVTRKFID